MAGMLLLQSPELRSFERISGIGSERIRYVIFSSIHLEAFHHDNISHTFWKRQLMTG
jgi:hypothetical protein